MTTIINESTSIVQVDSSGLQNGENTIIYVSTTSIPGQLVTVVDATGFTSSPQSIVISTTGGATLSDGTSSTRIRQRFGYITLVSQDTTNWTVVNSNSFSNPTISSRYGVLDTGTIDTFLANATGTVSTTSILGTSLEATSTALISGALYTSTLYVDSLSSFLTTGPRDYRMTIFGNEYISGPLLVTGRTSYRGSISTGSDLFTTGNISSKLGVIYVGGDVVAGGSIRLQRGIQTTVDSLSTLGSASFLRPVSIVGSAAGGSDLYARAIETATTLGTSMNVMSSIIFSDAYESIVNRENGLEIVGLGATIPSTIYTEVFAASQSIETSNVFLQNFGEMSTLKYLTLGSTTISNADGSLLISSIQGQSMHVGTLLASSAEVMATTYAEGLQMNDISANGDFSISFGTSVYDLSGYWVISSLSQSGTLNAAGASLSTTMMLTTAGSAAQLDTLSTSVTEFTTGGTVVGTAVYINGLSSFSAKRVRINNSMGSIMGSTLETIHEVHCSSLTTDQVSTGTAVRFLRPIAATLKDTYISTVTSGSLTTSSLTTTTIAAGRPESYSTINPSTPWVLTSTFQMNTGPFMVAKGLGTYYDEAIFVASMNETTYYSIVNPVAQVPAYLSSPYVNTIAGNGVPGPIQNGQVAAYAPLGSALSPAAADAENNIFIGSKDLGWKLQQISPAGTISTIGGNYRYFYGDGLYPLNAAFGRQLAVSVSPIGQVVITDISNVRIRALTFDPIVQTVAGTGGSSYSGDGGLAYLATLSTPTATATDVSGNIYVADTLNRIIRQISGSTITTYAGTPGVAGGSGDGGLATAATLTQPFGLAVDASKTLYMTDLSNCVIRSITTEGTINLVGGSYVSGYGGDGGPAIAATLSTPRGIAVDPNSNIYFCDTGNSRVRRIDAATQNITTVAGNGVQAYGGDGGLAINASLSTPTGVAVDPLGNLYISDTNNQCVRYVNMVDQKIRTVAGRPGQAGYRGDNSFARSALLNFPTHVAVDSNSGYVYIADDGNARIRYVDPAMQIIYSAAGNGSPINYGDGGPASYAVFGSISGLARDRGSNLYIVDDSANTVRVIDLTTSIISSIAGTPGIGGFSGDGGPSFLAQLSTPQQIALDSNATLYVTDRDNQRIRIISGGQISTLAGTGTAGYNGDNIPPILGQLNSPTALTIDASGSLYFADLNNNRIRQITSSGTLMNYAGSGLYGPPINNMSFASTTLASTLAIAVDSNSELYMTDLGTNAVWKLAKATRTLERISIASSGNYLGDAGPLSNAQFNTPNGLGVDRIGNLLITDQGNSRLRGTYTVGLPQIPVYLTMNFNYTNYFTSTGSAYIGINGNVVKNFYGSNQANDTYTLENANIYNYPMLQTNPVYKDQTPYIEITQANSYGYTKLDGILYVQQVPSQGLLKNSVDSAAGIQMNCGSLIFPHGIDDITIDNRFNDISTRSIFYSGDLFNASDPALKEDVRAADPLLCYSTLTQIPLKRYKYIDPYISTFHTKDVYRLGCITTDIEQILPKSVGSMVNDYSWGPSTVHTLDTAQIRMSHYGATQWLFELVSTLESKVEDLRAQRNSFL